MARKKISSWRQKKTFNVIAPESFNNQFVGLTIAADAKNVIGRTISISAKELTDDKTKQHFNITFEVTDVTADVAKTKFKKFSVSSGYLKSKIRKRMTKVEYIFDVVFAGLKTRVKVMVVGGRKISREQRKQIFSKIKNIFDVHRASKIDDIVQMIVFGKLGTEIFHGIKNICQIHRVEIQEIRVI